MTVHYFGRIKTTKKFKKVFVTHKRQFFKVGGKNETWKNKNQSPGREDITVKYRDKHKDLETDRHAKNMEHSFLEEFPLTESFS